MKESRLAFSITEEAGSIRFDIQVVPRASRNHLGPVVGDRLKVQLTAPPVDGAANEALRRFLAGAFRVPSRQVEIIHGETGRKKRVRVIGATRADLLSLLGDQRET